MANPSVPSASTTIVSSSGLCRAESDLGLMVVAEGVESKTIWSDLARLECDLAQGYYLSRPIPAQALADWVRERADARSQNTPAHGQFPGAGALDPLSAVARAVGRSA